jgi:hypothetical protein
MRNIFFILHSNNQTQNCHNDLSVSYHTVISCGTQLLPHCGYIQHQRQTTEGVRIPNHTAEGASSIGGRLLYCSSIPRNAWWFLWESPWMRFSVLDDIKASTENRLHSPMPWPVPFIWHCSGYIPGGLWMGYVVFIGIVNAYTLWMHQWQHAIYPGLCFRWCMWTINPYFHRQWILLNSLQASVVSLYFNFMKRAKCFAVSGEVSIAFLEVTLLLHVIKHTNLYGFGFSAWYWLIASYVLHRIYLNRTSWSVIDWFLPILANKELMQHRRCIDQLFYSPTVCSS